MGNNAVTPTNPALEQVDLEIPSGDAYEQWRKTGELPSSEEEMEQIEEKVRQEETGPSKGVESATPVKETPVTRADSGSAKLPQKKDANARIRELLANLKAERETNRKLAERLAAPPATTETRKEESQPAAVDASKGAAEPQIDEKNDKGEAKYKTWGEFQKAHDKWVFEEAERRATARIEERLSKTESERTSRETNQEREKTWKSRLTEARKSHEDYDEVALNPQLPIGVWVNQKDGKFELIPNSPIMDYLNESELGAEMAYWLGQNPDKVKEMTGLELREGGWFYTGQRMSLAKIQRELAMIELSLLPDEEETTTQRQPPSAKPVTKAPPPPRQVVGKSPQTKSEEAQALDDDDFEAYSKAANASELARRKGKR